ncbi:hypothetical protein [Nocardia tengchongensis]|uniref:hypothetical protein n=1 Tax=Nocardia tengchongensis TaxID=2055889 RepID=UPI00360EECB7
MTAGLGHYAVETGDARAGSTLLRTAAGQLGSEAPDCAGAWMSSLLAVAYAATEVDREESNSEAHQAGSLRMLDEAGELLAVWDGLPARGYGGTADVVATAHARGLPVTVLWPEGAERP